MTQAAGWKLPSREIKRRMILGIQGMERGGKSHLALTGRPPIYIHNFDYGLEGTVEKFAVTGKEIYVAEYRMPKAPRGQEQQVVKEAEVIYRQFREMWDDSVAKGEGTIIVDTHTEEWELRRLAWFGKLDQIMPQQYTELNNDFRAQVRGAYDSGMTVILIRKMGKVYQGNQPTGAYEPKGFSDLGYMVQSVLEAYRDPNDGKFKALVKDCRVNSMLQWQVLEGPMLNIEMFINLAVSTAPEL